MTRLDLYFQFISRLVSPQIPPEEVYESLRQEDLLHRIQHHRDLYVCHRQGVCMRPHGCYQRNAETLCFRRTTETNCNCLSLGHLSDCGGPPQDVWEPLTDP